MPNHSPNPCRLLALLRNLVGGQLRAVCVGMFVFLLGQSAILQAQSHGADPYATEAEAHDIEYMYAHNDLLTELSRDFTNSDVDGLAERRARLSRIFSRLTPTGAERIRKLLESRATSEASRLFHDELAKPARISLLAVLDGRINAAPTIVEGEIEIEDGVTHDQVDRAASRAKRILAGVDAGNDSWYGIEKLQCIVDLIASGGISFNDSYYPVAPEGKNLERTDNPLTCFKKPDTRTGEPVCRSGKDAVARCQRSFSEWLVNRNEAVGSDSQFLKLMMIKQDEIDRGVTYFQSIRAVPSKVSGSRSSQNTMMCKSAVTHLIPRMSNRHTNSIYNCYGNP